MSNTITSVRSHFQTKPSPAQHRERHNRILGYLKKKKKKKIQADRAETATVGKCTQPVLPSDSFVSKAHRKALQKCLLQRKAPILLSVDYVPLIARCCSRVCINPVRGPSAGLFPSLHRNSKPQHTLSRLSDGARVAKGIICL